MNFSKMSVNFKSQSELDIGGRETCLDLGHLADNWGEKHLKEDPRREQKNQGNSECTVGIS